MGDLHERVVNWVYQGVQRLTVGPDHNVVRNGSDLEGDVFAAYQVEERNVLVRHAHTQNWLAALGAERRLLLVGQGAVVAVVAHGLGTTRGDVACLDLLRRGERLVHVSTVNELLDNTLVDVRTLALAVWSVWSANVDALVPVNAEPRQRLNDLLVALFRVAFSIGVFDAEHHLAADVASVGPVEQGRADHSHVWGSGW